MKFESFEKEFLLTEKRTIKDREWKKIYDSVFDHYTIGNLFRAFLKADLQGLVHVISLGKEANVFKALTRDGKKRAVKIYRVETSDFRRMYEYINGDPRFPRVSRNRRKLVEAWCQKEFRNLGIGKEAGVRCPKPYAFAGNVLVMQYIGNETPAPLLKDTIIDNPEETLEEIVNDMKKLYSYGLVHSDLSEFNILYWRKKPWLIDFAQGVSLGHPRAREFLERDARNIANYFSKLGINVTMDDILSKVYSD